MSVYTGKRGRAQHNGTNLVCDKWSVDAKADIIPVPAFEDGAAAATHWYTAKAVGLEDATFTIEGYVDTTQTTAQTFAQGAALTLVKLFTDKNVGASCWQFPTAVVRQVNYQGEVKGVFRFSLQCEANGTYTPPSA